MLANKKYKGMSGFDKKIFLKYASRAFVSRKTAKNIISANLFSKAKSAFANAFASLAFARA